MSAVLPFNRRPGRDDGTRPNYAVRAKGATAEILLYDDIGDGFFGGVSAKQFLADLKGLGTVSLINLRINSQGGSAFEGIAIYNALPPGRPKPIYDRAKDRWHPGRDVDPSLVRLRHRGLQVRHAGCRPAMVVGTDHAA